MVRFTAGGHPVNSRPCNQCLNYLRGIEGIIIGTVYYFNSQGKFTAENFREMEKLHISSGYELISRKLDKSYVRCYHGH